MLILRTSPSLSPQGGNRFNASLAFNNIGNLANIEFLFAPACSLGGTINNEIENLQNLQFLSLMNNQLEGTVPESICNLNINFSLSVYYNSLYKFRILLRALHDYLNP